MKNTIFYLTWPRWLPWFRVMTRNAEAYLLENVKSSIWLEVNQSVSGKSRLAILYREQNDAWRFHWIIRRQKNATVIYSTFELWIFRSTNAEMPFKEVVLEEREQAILVFARYAYAYSLQADGRGIAQWAPSTLAPLSSGASRLQIRNIFVTNESMNQIKLLQILVATLHLWNVWFSRWQEPEEPLNIINMNSSIYWILVL